MEMLARLVHAEAGTRVVEVQACREGRPLASALGEGATAEEAEDRARTRLRALLPGDTAAPAATAPVPAGQPGPPSRATGSPQDVEPPQDGDGVEAAVQEPPPDPEDWSAELARLDLALQRLGWGREEEGRYLQRAFQLPGRNRLTTYADLRAYLEAIESMEPGTDPAEAAVPLRRRDLLAQCEQLLEQLGWDREQARGFLQKQLGVASRLQLSDEQLLGFNMRLEEELLGPGSGQRA